MTDESRRLQQQIDYYRARAPEYDDWFFRRGRYDRGPQANADWFADVALLRGTLEKFKPAGDVLELACGTGLWTEQLLPYARSLTAVDASPETLAINRARVGAAAGVQFVQADLFAWHPQATFDVVFFGFWLSHVPPDLFEPFWRLVAGALRPGGRVFFVDSKFEPSSTARDHVLENAQADSVVRRLNDGREFQVVKVFYRPGELQARLRSLGWSADIRETPRYFLLGEATRDADRRSISS
jgi:SAM-dependent methyltransferase